MHIVVPRKNDFEVKSIIKEKLKQLGIMHSTLEMELASEHCNQEECVIHPVSETHHHH